MLISCPDCAVCYDTGDAELENGRRTRCVRCGRVWTPIARSIPPEPVLTPPPPPQPTAPSEPQAPPQAPPQAVAPPRTLPPLPRETWSFPPAPLPTPPHRRSPLRLAAVVGLLALFAVAFIAFRAQAEAAWPPIARLYGALGLG